jgi:hypothetical protein
MRGAYHDLTSCGKRHHHLSARDSHDDRGLDPNPDPAPYLSERQAYREKCRSMDNFVVDLDGSCTRVSVGRRRWACFEGDHPQRPLRVQQTDGTSIFGLAELDVGAKSGCRLAPGTERLHR